MIFWDIPKTCDATKSKPNNSISIGNCSATLQVGDTCKPECRAGYHLKSDSECQPDGSVKVGECVRNALF